MINPNLTIISISIKNYKFPVPDGFSELINHSGAWRYKTEDSANEEKDITRDYERRVKSENGKLRTYLTYKSPVTS
jgi:hypothetical protein